jgi:hypothetical protein
VISTDNLVWHLHSRYPQPWELQKRTDPIYHRCGYDTPVTRLGEGNKRIAVSTPQPGVYEFLCRDCGQRVRISFKLWDTIKEDFPNASVAK